eukprot:PITA_05074
MSTIIQVEPPTFEEAVKEQVWKDVMAEEYKSIMKNDVWEVILRPKGKSIVPSKWLYKIKHGANGSIEKYKARFVPRGFSQKEGEDCDDIFAPVTHYTTIRSSVSLGTSQGWTLHQMDVKTAFFHGILREEVFIEQPLGFEVHDKKTHVCSLKKALYDLKQALIAWYARIDSYMVKLGFTTSNVDPNLYFNVCHEEVFIEQPLGFEVHDRKTHVCSLKKALYGLKQAPRAYEPLMLECKRELASEFEMKDLGLMHYFLGLEVCQKPKEIFLFQGKYVVKLLERFGMVMQVHGRTNGDDLQEVCGDAAEPNLANPYEYRQLIGVLMFLVNTHPDICFAVSTLSQFITEPLHATGLLPSMW